MSYFKAIVENSENKYFLKKDFYIIKIASGNFREALLCFRKFGNDNHFTNENLVEFRELSDFTDKDFKKMITPIIESFSTNYNNILHFKYNRNE